MSYLQLSGNNLAAGNGWPRRVHQKPCQRRAFVFSGIVEFVKLLVNSRQFMRAFATGSSRGAMN
jgi:hypothetical protein